MDTAHYAAPLKPVCIDDDGTDRNDDAVIGLVVNVSARQRRATVHQRGLRRTDILQ